MKNRWLPGLSALLLGALILAIPASSATFHEHPAGVDKGCALCHSLHLPGSLSLVPGVSSPVRAEAVRYTAVLWETERLPSSDSNRGPPLRPRTS